MFEHAGKFELSRLIFRSSKYHYQRMKYLRPRSHGNAVVPFYLRSSVWNAKMDCSHGNRTITYRLLCLFTRERNHSVPQFCFSPCHFFQQELHPRMLLGQKSYRSVFWTSLAPHCLFVRERNGTIAYRSTFRITFYRSPFWNGTMLFQAFPCEHNP